MINNRIELSRADGPKVLITWHLPREDGSAIPIAFQFADDLEEAARLEVLSAAKRPLKVPEKQNKLAQPGTSDHFGALPRVLSRLGFRPRVFGASMYRHALDDRPVHTI